MTKAYSEWPESRALCCSNHSFARNHVGFSNVQQAVSLKHLLSHQEVFRVRLKNGSPNFRSQKPSSVFSFFTLWLSKSERLQNYHPAISLSSHNIYSSLVFGEMNRKLIHLIRFFPFQHEYKIISSSTRDSLMLYIKGYKKFPRILICTIFILLNKYNLKM